jgi:hypothetical protein
MSNKLDLSYNTEDEKVLIPEYGRNIQKMIEHAQKIEDKPTRQKCAEAIVKIMKQISVQLKNDEDFDERLWSHLFIMADFNIDIESPYKKPVLENLISKPDEVPYPSNIIKYGHYGKIIGDLIKEAANYPEGEDKEEITKHVANLLKTSYLYWNRDSVNDNLIVKHLEEFSDGKLTIDISKLNDTSEILRNIKPQRNLNKNHKRQQNHKYKKRR